MKIIRSSLIAVFARQEKRDKSIYGYERREKVETYMRSLASILNY
ncbi:hypothetical protein HanHA300_Chr11g0412461 [Helianthus annuus]|nr:hypothetical protein HanHA300_Chr11g0412461 [Helianthus annuus]